MLEDLVGAFGGLGGSWPILGSRRDLRGRFPADKKF